VVAADRRVAGVIKDIWVDRAESFIRFYEIALADGGGDVLMPAPFGLVDRARRRIQVDAILADQFANVPKLRDPDQVTMFEEEKIAAYYAAGTLYATPARVEPLL
jgi:photosynthetic reaction center H subunit